LVERHRSRCLRVAEVHDERVEVLSEAAGGRLVAAMLEF
jgi:hypothetical protein